MTLLVKYADNRSYICGDLSSQTGRGHTWGNQFGAEGKWLEV